MFAPDLVEVVFCAVGGFATTPPPSVGAQPTPMHPSGYARKVYEGDAHTFLPGNMVWPWPADSF